MASFARKRTVAALVRIAALEAAGDDGVGGRASGVKHGGVHLGAKALGGEGSIAPLEEAALVRLARLKHIDAAAQAGLGHAQSGGERGDFLLGFARRVAEKKAGRKR